MEVLEVPANAYYGNTRRAILNFPLSDLRFGKSFIRAIDQLKLCATEFIEDRYKYQSKALDATCRA